MNVYELETESFKQIIGVLNVKELLTLCSQISKEIILYLTNAVPEILIAEKRKIRMTEVNIKTYLNLVETRVLNVSCAGQQILMDNLTVESCSLDREGKAFLAMYKPWKEGTICTHLMIDFLYTMLTESLKYISNNAVLRSEAMMANQMLREMNSLAMILRNATEGNLIGRFCLPNTRALYIGFSVNERERYYIKYSIPK